MPRTRTFRRVHLHELDEYEAAGWVPASGAVVFSLYSSGHGEEAIVELRLDADFADAIAASMERK